MRYKPKIDKRYIGMDEVQKYSFFKVGLINARALGGLCISPTYYLNNPKRPISNLLSRAYYGMKKLKRLLPSEKRKRMESREYCRTENERELFDAAEKIIYKKGFYLIGKCIDIGQYHNGATTKSPLINGKTCEVLVRKGDTLYGYGNEPSYILVFEKQLNGKKGKETYQFIKRVPYLSFKDDKRFEISKIKIRDRKETEETEEKLILEYHERLRKENEERERYADRYFSDPEFKKMEDEKSKHECKPYTYISNESSYESSYIDPSREAEAGEWRSCPFGEP